MRVELNAPERLVLFELLPPTHTAINYRLIEQVRMAVAFTEEEIAEFAIVRDEDTGRTDWDRSKDAITKTVDIAGPVVVIIIGILEKLDSGEKIGAHNITLHDKFVSIDRAEEEGDGEPSPSDLPGESTSPKGE